MKLPLTYDNYIFDLYGTLVDIHTDESDTAIWEKLAMFYGYYGALYEAKELKERYETLVKSSEAELKKKIESLMQMRSLPSHMPMKLHRRYI